MKKTFLILLVLFFSCSNKNKFEITDSKIFVSNENDTLKLNINCTAKGYKLDEFRGGYFSKLSFKIDIKNPNGVIDTTVQHGVVDQVARKGIIDSPINTKYILPEKYTNGNYRVILKVTDEFSGEKLKLEKSFEIKR